MATRFIVVLSDLHIGTNQPTNWYQASVHGPYLEAVLGYLERFSDQVRELVLLGDFVDLWTYLPQVKPPTFGDIIAQSGNAGVIARLRAVLDAVPAVSFVPGNHDMAVEQSDLDGLAGPKTGKTIDLCPSLYRPLGNDSVLCTHGHLYSMMCAPYQAPANPISPLPIGYYATRAGAYFAAQQIAAHHVQNVAQLPDTGEPTGTNITTQDVFTAAADVLLHSVGHALMNVIQAGTGLDWDTEIVMPGNLAPRSLDAAIDDFKELFDSIAESVGPDGKELGDGGAWKSLLLPDVDNDLTSYAAALADRYASKLVVMGHTHVPRANERLRVLSASGAGEPTPFAYANSGFNCPSIPDMQDSGKIPTFVSIGVDDATNTPVSVEHRAVLTHGGGAPSVSSAALLGPLSLTNFRPSVAGSATLGSTC